MMLEFLMTYTTASIAVLLTVISVFSGLKVLGSGYIWKFQDGAKPYFEGDAGAWLYMMVLLSTMLSVWHAGLLTDWILREGRFIIGEDITDVWNIWHAITSAYFSLMHIFVYRFMVKRNDQPKDHKVKKLWD